MSVVDWKILSIIYYIWMFYCLYIETWMTLNLLILFLYCCVFLKLYKQGNIINNFSHNHYFLVGGQGGGRAVGCISAGSPQVLVVHVSSLTSVASLQHTGFKKVGVIDVLISCWDIIGLFAKIKFFTTQNMIIFCIG